ncbi:MAG: hypothetical protein K0R66_53 [Gammaproteobacteria bacterium]|nr:hypothetical protein [Gammaproteobacteria bacterium]
MKVKCEAKIRKGSADFPLKDYEYYKNGNRVEVSITKRSYRQKFHFELDDVPSDFERALVNYTAETWSIIEAHKYSDGSIAQIPKKMLKLNASLPVASDNDIQECLKYFLKPDHNIFNELPYGGQEMYKTSQDMSFRYHADRHHGLPGKSDLAFTEEESNAYLKDIGNPATGKVEYHSLGLSVNKAAAQGKYGNIELKFAQRPYKVILNLHLAKANPGEPTLSRAQVLEILQLFRSFAFSIRNDAAIGNFFKGFGFTHKFIKEGEIIPEPLPAPAPVPKPAVKKPDRLKSQSVFMDAMKHAAMLSDDLDFDE